MILITITLLAGIVSLLFLLFTKICNDWYDFWMIIPTFLIAWIAVALVIVIVIFISTLFINKRKDYDKPSKFYRFLVLAVCELLVEFFRVEINVHGLEKVPLDKQFCLVQNHNSYIDPIITMWVFRSLPLVYVMKKEIMKAPFVSHALYRNNFPALDRDNNREALKTIINTINLIKDGKNSIGIFPEGTRSKDGEIHEFKAGSFKIPEKANCPIVVSVLKNTRMVSANFPFKKTQVYLDVIDVINPEDFQGENTPELSDEVHNMMVKRMEELKELDK